MDKKKESIQEILTKERGTDSEMLCSTGLQWVLFTLLILVFLFLLAMKEVEPELYTTIFVLALFFIPNKQYQKKLKIQAD